MERTLDEILKEAETAKFRLFKLLLEAHGYMPDGYAKFHAEWRLSDIMSALADCALMLQPKHYRGISLTYAEGKLFVSGMGSFDTREAAEKAIDFKLKGESK